MMHSIKFTILFSVVLFSAYTEYKAGNVVKKIKMSRSQSQVDKTASEGDLNFMKRAMELSQMALQEKHGHPFGSVVVRDGKILGEGWNKVRLLNDPSAHAEVEAIRDASKKFPDGDIKGSTIYASAEP